MLLFQWPFSSVSKLPSVSPTSNYMLFINPLLTRRATEKISGHPSRNSLCLYKLQPPSSSDTWNWCTNECNCALECAIPPWENHLSGHNFRGTCSVFCFLMLYIITLPSKYILLIKACVSVEIPIHAHDDAIQKLCSGKILALRTAQNLHQYYLLCTREHFQSPPVSTLHNTYIKVLWEEIKVWGFFHL